jgi:acetylcholinesterase
MADYLIRFAANLDPNGDTGISWPEYSQADPSLLTFNDGIVLQSLSKDDFRVDSMRTLNQVLLTSPFWTGEAL